MGRPLQGWSPGPSCKSRGSEIAEQPAGNILESLEGRVPGLVIRQTNGVPGSAYGVLIRGRQSISQGTDPLVVIDGVPVASNNGYLSLIGSGSAQGSTGASNLNGIPSAAIKSIEVLKGAAATAIYGSRGSNGVLLVTLKTGATGPIKWDVDVYTGADQSVRTSALMNTQQYLAMRRQAVENDGLPVNASTVPEQYLWDSTRYTDFKKFTIGNTRQRQNARIELVGRRYQYHVSALGQLSPRGGCFPRRQQRPTDVAVRPFEAAIYEPPVAGEPVAVIQLGG